MALVRLVLQAPYEELITTAHAALLQLRHPSEPMHHLMNRIFLLVASPQQKLVVACKASVNTLQVCLTFCLPAFLMLVAEQSARRKFLAAQGIRPAQAQQLREVLPLAYVSLPRLLAMVAQLLLSSAVLTWLVIYPVHAVYAEV
jgi:hypothetical protein